MKYIITEQQLKNTIKKFNKENIERDKLSNIMEELVLRFFENKIPILPYGFFGI